MGTFKLLRRLRSDRGGVALLEFALSLPLLITITVSGLEIAWYALCNQQINQLASQAADNAARVKNTIDETDINEIMAATTLNGARLDFNNRGRVIISSIQLNDAKNGQWIRWQRCTGSKSVASAYGAEGKGKTDSSLTGIGSSTPKMTAAAGVAIILAEVRFDYKPLITSRLFGTTTMKAEQAYVVRQRTDLSLTNTTNIASGSKLTC
ncbi:TadE/TadG family type IV pilus assembly protein [Novosphingobium sp. JCM 18896]|uniref:TadE/TadG family type IV pilus assembly protein n=1 Tax=Novosphingobium sp. JCM 18896 TaxID=2989731 RepID=UPI0022219850|nr:TadE/TadG family type IV pilus assembly protein [Novosphingobium sp. JCM 18896]MCW1429880.1 pilus assembly protein [Novosphingobium sp. JCM 18896]